MRRKGLIYRRIIVIREIRSLNRRRRGFFLLSMRFAECRWYAVVLLTAVGFECGESDTSGRSLLDTLPRYTCRLLEM